MANYEKIAEILQNEALVREANTCKTMEEFHDFFNRNGAEINMEETIDLISKIAEKAQAGSDELDEEAMDGVSGGLVLTGAAAVLACIGLGVAGIGVGACAAYVGYQTLRWELNHRH